MTEKEALKVLCYYQKWRRGAEIAMPDPKQVGLAIDVAIRVLKNFKKMKTEPKTWEFSYRTMEAMRKANPGYDSGNKYEVCDPESFHSKSSNFEEACKEFDEFERDNELWDVDPEASFNHGEEYRCIIGHVNYNSF